MMACVKKVPTYDGAREDEVEQAVGSELETIGSSHLPVERLQLRLALVELGVVLLLQRDTAVRVVDVHSKLVSNALHLTAGT